jgi:hypothetical protein
MNSRQAIVIIILSILVFSSCAQKKLKYVDIDKSYKMYFIDIAYQEERFSECNFIETFGNFYISEQDFLPLLKNEIIKEKTQLERTGCLYAITIMQEGKITFGGFLDAENGIINTSKIYNFDLEKLSSQKDYFKKLEAFEVNCFSISKTEEFINELEKEGGYIFGYTGVKKNDVFNYAGRMKLVIDSTIIEPNQDYEKIKKSIVEKFVHLDDIEIIRYTYSSGDSITLEILCNNDFSKKMPTGFEIIEPLTDSINLPFAVYDIPDFTIKSVANKMNIETLSIRNLNN